MPKNIADTPPHIIVDILIPVYNASSYLKERLDSIARQKNVLFRILIADNCSDDDSHNIIKNFAINNSQVIVYKHSNNIGAINNFAFLLQQSQAKYVIFAGDHDVWSGSNMLNSLVDEMETDPSLALCAPTTRWIDKNSRNIDRLTEVAINTRGSKNAAVRISKLNKQMGYASIFYGLHRSHHIKSVFPLSFGLDIEALYKIACQGDIMTHPTATWFRRVVRNDTTASKISRYAKMLCISEKEFVIKSTNAIAWVILNASGSITDRFKLLFYIVLPMYISKSRRTLLWRYLITS